MKPKKVQVPDVVEIDDKDYEVEQIVGHKFKGIHTWYQIRWKGYAPEDDTWQAEKDLDCPELIKQYNDEHPDSVRSLPPLMMMAKKNKALAAAAADNSGSDDDDSNASVTDGRDWEVRRILDVYYCQNGTREFLIRWKGYNEADDTWEPEAHLNCGDLIEGFMSRLERAKIAEPKQLRVRPKHTERLVYMDPSGGRRLSRRQDGRQR